MLFGRAEECARVEGLLEDARRGRSGTLVVRGEAGIGKTALLRYARSRAAGMRVLEHRAVRAEAELPFAALHGLLRPLLPLLERLPQAQEEAVGSLLGLCVRPEAQLLAAYGGVLGLIAEAAEEEPLLLLVDDAHWLDGGSAAALSFAARRLVAESVAILLAERVGAESVSDLFVLGTELRLSGLDADAGRALLVAEFGEVEPGVAAALTTACGGNPLALVEAGRALSPDQLAAKRPLPEPLPIAADVAETFLPVVRQLPRETERALLVAAVGEGLPQETIAAASEATGGGERLLAPAQQAGLIELGRAGVRFCHPLVRSAVYAAASPAERREAHRAIAMALASVDDEDRRALHLAAAADGPSEDVAEALERAAERARRRGGYSAQATALERAAQLSADDQHRARRLHAACRAAYWAGEKQRALRLGNDALVVARDPLVRADVVHQLAVIAEFDRELQPRAPSSAALERIAAEIEPLDGERAIALLGVVLQRHRQALDTEAAHAIAKRRLAIAERIGGERLLRARQDLAATLCLRGDAEAAAEVLDGVAEARAQEETLPAYASQAAESLLWSERYDELRELLGASLADARAHGNVLRVCFDLTNLAALELRLGRLDAAAATAGEALLLAQNMESHYLEACNLATLAGIDARRGAGDALRDHGDRAAVLAHALGENLVRGEIHLARGLFALATGALDDALDELERAVAIVTAGGVVEPGVLPVIPELVETHARRGERATAAGLLDGFRRAADRTRRGWALAAAARCDALLASVERMDAHFEEAIGRYELQPMPFEQARTRLYYGERLRRAQRRRDARRELRVALDQLQALGARIWADRAATELRATGETIGPRDPTAAERLTPQELQIALLVADGKTNKEVGAALFLSPKTVEYHLAHVYRKLGLHSRRELILIFASRGAPAAELAGRRE